MMITCKKPTVNRFLGWEIQVDDARLQRQPRVNFNTYSFKIYIIEIEGSGLNFLQKNLRNYQEGF